MPHITRRSALLSSLFLIPSAIGGVTVASRRRATCTFSFHHDNVLGTSLDVIVVTDSAARAEDAEQAVLRQVSADAAILSGYRDDSEFRRWTRTQGHAVPVSPELFTVLSLFDDWRQQSQGAVDAAAERVSGLWREAEARQQHPSVAELHAAVADVQQTHWHLDRVARTATHLSEVPLMLNSFTKSYIVDRAARAALTIDGVTAAVVNVGGDIVTRGDWIQEVGVADPANDADNARPMTTLQLRDRAVATSGGYRRGVDIDRRHLSHLVDPRTGRPTDHVLSATVVAPDATVAGALATALCVMTPAEGARLAAAHPQAEFLLILMDGQQLHSSGWRALEKPASSPAVSPSLFATVYAAEPGWSKNFEMTVALELARPAANARRPYIAVWIEDADKFPVKTLALWFQKPRWLPELRAWYRDDRLRAMAEGTDIVPTVSSATRAPGKYTLTWDGKDQQGKIVPPGAYTVCVELAREHGTYQITRQPMTFGNAPARVELAANTELAGGSIEYHAAAGH